jgi:hypothetical protein
MRVSLENSQSGSGATVLDDVLIYVMVTFVLLGHSDRCIRSMVIRKESRVGIVEGKLAEITVSRPGGDTMVFLDL